MAVLSGSMSAARFRVLGELPDHWQTRFQEQLMAFSFQDQPQEQRLEEREGWCLVQNLLDTDFAQVGSWLMGDYLAFALRVDKKRLPAKLFRATLDKRCQAWSAAHEGVRVPARVRGEIKEALQEEWLKRTLPTVQVVEAVWSISGGYLLLHGFSEAVTSRFAKRFTATFGLKLAPWSPLDLLADERLGERLLESVPAGPGREQGG